MPRDNPHNNVAHRARDGDITIAVMNTTHVPIFFKLGRTVRLRGLKKAYGERLGIDPAMLRLRFRGRWVADEDRSVDLGMVQGDEIVDLTPPMLSVRTVRNAAGVSVTVEQTILGIGRRLDPIPDPPGILPGL